MMDVVGSINIQGYSGVYSNRTPISSESVLGASGHMAAAHAQGLTNVHLQDEMHDGI